MNFLICEDDFFSFCSLARVNVKLDGSCRFCRFYFLLLMLALVVKILINVDWLR